MVRNFTSGGLPVAGLFDVSRYPLFDLRPILLALWAFTNAFKPDILNSHSQRSDLLGALVHLLHPHHPRAVRTVHIDCPWLNRVYTDFVFDKILFPLLFNIEIAVSETIRLKLDRRLLARLLKKERCCVAMALMPSSSGKNPLHPNKVNYLRACLMYDRAWVLLVD